VTIRHILVIAVALCLLLSVIGFGLPSSDRMAIVNGGAEPSQEFLSSLTRLRAKPFSAAAKKLEENKADHAGKSEALALGEIATAYRAFVLGSSQFDERHVYSTLSRMNPAELDFDPGSYLYGGGYTYTVGAVLYSMKAVGLLVVNSDLGYYAVHPEQAARIFIAGRSLSVIAFCGILVLMCMIGRRFASDRAIFLSLLFFSLTPVAGTMATISKPHLFAAFFVVLGIYLIQLYMEKERGIWLMLSGVAMGVAVGSSIVTAPAFAAYPVLLWRAGSSGKVFRQVGLAVVSGLVGYCVLNPYVIVDIAGFSQQIGASSGKHGVPMSVGSFWLKFKVFVWRGFWYYSPLFAVFFVAALCFAFFRGHSVLRRHSVWSIIVLLFMAVTINRIRMAIYVLPFVALMAGVLLEKTVSCISQSANIRKVLIGVFFIPAMLGCTLFLYERIDDKYWYGPMDRWLNSASLSQQSLIAINDTLGPESITPIPLIASRVIGVSALGEERPDYVVVSGRDRARWEVQPMRAEYVSIVDLRGIESKGFAYWFYSTVRYNAATVYARSDQSVSVEIIE